MARAFALPFLYMLACVSWAQGHRPRGSSSIHGGAIRKRLHVRPLVTESGSTDLEFDSNLTYGSVFSVPVRLRFTPPGPHWYWGGTEFSVTADALDNERSGDHRVTHSGDNITLNLTTATPSFKGFAFAAGPQVTAYVRENEGVRAGAVGIGRWTWNGVNNAGFTLSWTGATAPSPANPASTLDCGAGYGRDFGKFTLFGNYVWERSSGLQRLHIFSSGFEWEFNDRFSIDVSGEVSHGQPGYQILVGVAIGLTR